MTDQHTKDRLAAREIAKITTELTANIWHTEPEKHLLAQLVDGDPSKAVDSANELNRHLEEALANIFSLSSMELTMWLRSTSSVKSKLPAWESLLEATHKELCSRFDLKTADDRLRGLRSKSVV